MRGERRSMSRNNRHPPELQVRQCSRVPDIVVVEPEAEELELLHFSDVAYVRIGKIDVFVRDFVEHAEMPNVSFKHPRENDDVAFRVECMEVAPARVFLGLHPESDLPKSRDEFSVREPAALTAPRDRVDIGE